MTDMESVIITIEDEEGHAYTCKMLGIFEYAENDYALLKMIHEDSMVLMRVTEQENHMVFRTIEDHEEFERVRAHVEDLATSDDDDADEDGDYE